MSFFALVYSLTRQIPLGKVTTYGALARALSSRDARRVGHALHANTDPQTPCHRVVNKEGRLAPNYAFGGSLEQYALLKEEGVTFLDRNHVNLALHYWQPPTPKDLSP
ncbi:MAG: methylated-DNA--[protein]-cysteine S-methyltransferase [bacterium]